ncbi:MAG: NADH-quinone oxidoreductase subunit N [Parachlamydia sp.]|nr:NADH-quinone oxidoreductase subunit N [Parachlamydia sp.]
MNITFGNADFAALSPLLILFSGTLLLLLVEAFAETLSRKYASYITLATLAAALYAVSMAPASSNPLLTPWVKFDSLARLFTIFFLIVGLASTLLAIPFFQRFLASYPTPRGEFYFLLLSAVFGLILIGIAADFLTLFLGLETLSIALYILVGYMKKWPLSHEAAIKYFLMGALGTAFLLYGIALIYGATGSTSFEGLLPAYQKLSGSSQTLFLSGIALVTLGLAFKAAIVPFHVWAPDVYDGAPTPVTAFMAVGTKVGAFAAFARVFLIALPNFNPIWNEVLSFLACLTLIYANYVAMRQTQLRRFFAYSGISHAGFLLIPLVASTPDSLNALLFYLVIYALATLGAFAVLAFLDRRSAGVSLSDLRGLFSRSPLLAGILALCLLTLAGIPPTVGFFAKFYLFKVAFEAGYYGLVVVALLTTILSAYYYLRFVAAMFAEGPAEEGAPTRSWPAAVVGLLACAAIVLLSIYPAPLSMLLGR